MFDIADQQLESSVGAILEEVETQLRDGVASADPLVHEAAQHLLVAGGKRFRPLLCAIGGQFGVAGKPNRQRSGVAGKPNRGHGGVAGELNRGHGGVAGEPNPGLSGVAGERNRGHGGVAGNVDRGQDGEHRTPLLAPAAVCVELTHLATLYHDDVMDEAVVRRSAPSANARWSNSVAILVGDYLFARAADIAADLGPEAVRIQARTFSRLVHGQIAETVGPRDTDPVTHYLQVVGDKTASLISTSARFGGMFGGAEPAVTEALAEFGETIGIAFQLSDDLLDIASESAESGKTPGTDLREGVPTLPVLYALASADADAASARLREILADGAVTDDERHAEALSLLRESAALKRARETVRWYAERARSQLTPLPEGPARRALAGLCDVIVDRTS